MNQPKNFRIVVEDTAIRNCKFCDFERWMNIRQEHVYFSSVQQLQQVVGLDEKRLLPCTLCSYLCKVAYSLVRATGSDKADEVRIRARLDVDLKGIGTGRDSLLITYAGDQREVEICLNQHGKHICSA